MNPLALSILAVAAAAVAALAGHRLHPARQRARRRAQQREALRFLAVGKLSRPGEWTRFWYEHELDDVARGGA